VASSAPTSSHGALEHGDTIPDVAAEPDEVPTRYISILAAVVTVGIVATVAFAFGLFKVYTAMELADKGYAQTSSATWGSDQ